MGGGCALGLYAVAPHWATAAPPLVLQVPRAVFLLAALLGIGCIVGYCRQPRIRVLLLLGILGAGGGAALLAAQRALPPAGDLSLWVRGAPVPAGPQRPLTVTLIGQVAAPPYIGQWNMQFPLACSAIMGASGKPAAGCVWAVVPPGAAGGAPLRAGDSLTMHARLADLPRAGNPGERSPQARFIAAHCWCIARATRPSDVRRTGAAAGGVSDLLTNVRGWLLRRYQNDFTRAGLPYPAATAQLLLAMVCGTNGLQDELPQATSDRWRAAGMTHLLVASGSQVAFLCLFVVGAARLLGVRRWWLLAVALPALLGYALLAGGSASIWRATVGGLCLACALVLGRDTDGLSLWALALTSLLLIDPYQLADIGFELTFAATWGLLVVTPAMRPAVRRLLGSNRFGELTAYSLAAQMATAPLLLYHFGRLSLTGIGVNLVAVPMAGFLVAGGTGGLLLPPLNILNYGLVRLLDGIAGFAAAAPGAQADLPPLPLAQTVLCYLLLGAITLCAAVMAKDARAAGGTSREPKWRAYWEGLRAELAARGQKRRLHPWRWQPAFLILLAAATVLCGWRALTQRERTLHIVVLDVGQGESIIVRSPSGRTVLIDGGTRQDESRGEVGREVIVPALQAMGVQKVDAVVVTHADSDHCNGLPTVLREVPVGMMLDGGTGGEEHHAPARAAAPLPDDTDAADYGNLKNLWEKLGITAELPHPGERLQLGDGVIITVLAPMAPSVHNRNDDGIVLRLDYGRFSMLFTADIEAEAEERLVRRGAALHCTVLKVAHHGSSTSSSPLFLKAAGPRVAVISCGRYNAFGHPAPQTLGRLARAHIAAYRTDRDGAVDISSDGRACWIRTYR